MLIWRGKGILVLLIVAVAFAISILFVAFLKSQLAIGLTPRTQPLLGIAVAALIAAGLNFWFARYLDDPSKHRTLIDPKTNQAYVFKDGSSLMFIPVRYWTYILLAFALLNLVGLIAQLGQN